MSRSQPGVSNSAASGDGLCRPQIAAHGPAPNNGIVMNGIDVLEQDGFREVRGSDPSSPRAVGVITNHTGFDVEGRRTIALFSYDLMRPILLEIMHHRRHRAPAL